MPAQTYVKPVMLVMRGFVQERPRSYGSDASSAAGHVGPQTAMRNRGANTTSASLRGHPLEPARSWWPPAVRDGRTALRNRAACPRAVDLRHTAGVAVIVPPRLSRPGREPGPSQPP